MDALASANVSLFDGFRFDRRGGVLSRRDERGMYASVVIGSRALGILGVLIDRSGDLVSRAEILEAVWPGIAVEDSNLNVQIAALRRILDHDRDGASCIQTVSGRGYRFTAAVTPVEADVDPYLALNSRDGTPANDIASLRLPGVTASTLNGPDLRPHLPRGLFKALMILGITCLVVITGLVVVGDYHWFDGADTRPRLSLVVLPFANLGNDPDQEYFVDAITDDLTTDLSRISGSVVIARTTAFTYKGKSADIKQIGRELGVHYVLAGSVRGAGDQVRVNVQLVDTETATQLWADRFETNRANLTRAQTEITGRLAQTLHVELVEAVGRRIEQQAAANLDARDLVMRGLALYYRPSSAATRQEAQRAFERALEIDPGSVDAQIGIAVILTTGLGTGSSRAVQQDEARAERLLVEALERDANRPMAHEIMGMLRRVQNRLAESKIEFETAVALDRNDAHAWLGLGQTLMFLGRPELGIADIEHAMRLDPLNPNAAFAHWSLGACRLLLGHVNEALDLLRKARAENPRIYFFHLYLASALGLGDNLDEARAALAEAVKLKPEVNSLARWRDYQPWIDNPQHRALREKAVDVGLRRAGMPE
jgi:TolB-like protein/DNA-binding winged helix-turn-helix (wHTH) protein/Flp pilus assembly protein TadD